MSSSYAAVVRYLSKYGSRVVVEEPLDDVMVFKERSNALIVVHY